MAFPRKIFQRPSTVDGPPNAVTGADLPSASRGVFRCRYMPQKRVICGDAPRGHRHFCVYARVSCQPPLETSWTGVSRGGADQRRKRPEHIGHCVYFEAIGAPHAPQDRLKTKASICRSPAHVLRPFGANAVTITVTVRHKVWAAGIDSCPIAALWRTVSSGNGASERRLGRVHRDELVLEAKRVA